MRTLFSCLILLSAAVAQTVRTDVPDMKARADGALTAASATIAVCTQPANTATTPCSPLATLYTDATLTTACAGTLKDGSLSGAANCSNPLITDARGNHHFYAAPGVYTVQTYGSGITTLVQPDQVVACDPTNCLSPKSNGVLTVGGGITYWAGADLGAQINSAITAAGSAGALIFIPCGTYSVSTTVTVGLPNISIKGENSACVSISYTGTSDFLRIQMNPFVITQAGHFGGMTITGTASGISGIHVGDIVGAEFSDIRITGFTGASGRGIWFDNNTGWMERTLLNRIHSDGNKVDFRWTNGSGVNNQASFGYTRAYDLRCNLTSGQTCLAFDGGRFYHSILTLISNSSSASSTLISITGLQYTAGPGTAVDSSEFMITAEGPANSTNFSVAAGTQFSSNCGYIDYPNSINSVTGTVRAFLCYMQGASSTYDGLWSNGAQLLAGQPADGHKVGIIPSFDAGTNFKGGVLYNGQYNGTNLTFDTTGSHNGGGGILFSHTGDGGVYSLGDSGTPTASQTTSVATLDTSNKLLGFSPTGTTVNKGVGGDGSGVKHKRVTTGSCATTGCQVTLTWGTAFADTSYTVTCSVQDSTAQSETTGLRLAKINTVNAGSVLVDIDNLSGAGVTGTLECIAFHD